MKDVKKNRMDEILKLVEIYDAPLLNDFNFEGVKDFKYLCTIKANKNKERLEIIDQIENFNDITGIIYFLTIEGHIIKIGQTINNFKSRLQSYNCGKMAHRKKGTASTTNWFILQSLLALNKNVEVFYFQPEKPKTIHVWGENITSSKPIHKLYENKLINEYSKYFGKKPCGNVQK